MVCKLFVLTGVLVKKKKKKKAEWSPPKQRKSIIQLIQYIVRYIFAKIKYWATNQKAVFQKSVDNLGQIYNIDYIPEWVLYCC